MGAWTFNRILGSRMLAESRKAPTTFIQAACSPVLPFVWYRGRKPPCIRLRAVQGLAHWCFRVKRFRVCPFLSECVCVCVCVCTTVFMSSPQGKNYIYAYVCISCMYLYASFTSTQAILQDRECRSFGLSNDTKVGREWLSSEEDEIEIKGRAEIVHSITNDYRCHRMPE